MVPGREDIIVGGLVVLVATIERLGLDGCLSSESDILDGMVASLRSW
jgi:exopolyphosphatase/pppGpp-phosphohydrolase